MVVCIVKLTDATDFVVTAAEVGTTVVIASDA